MESLDESLIREYMNLRQKRIRVIKHLKAVERLFWSQSFMRCSLDVDEAGNPSRIVRFDKQVEALADLESLTSQITQELTFKRHYWQAYINSLNGIQRAYLVVKYKRGDVVRPDDQLELSALNECNQIEEATARKFGYADEVAIDVTDDVNSMMNQVLGMIP